MSTRESTVVHVANEADFDAFLERLHEMRQEQVIVTLDDGSDALLTAVEYHRAATIARAGLVALAISTRDNLRQQLARMLGWTVVEPIGPAGAGEARSVGKTTADLATYRPERLPSVEAAPPAAAKLDAASETATAPVVATPDNAKLQGERTFKLKPPQAQVHVERPRRATIASGTTADVAVVPPPRSRPAEPEPFEEPRPRRRRRWLQALIIGVPLLLLISAGSAGAAYYYVPTATIQLVPLEHSISVDLVYGVARPDAKYDLTVDPVPVSHSVSFTKTINTTGSRTEPDATAAGTLQLLNPSAAVITVPAGTTLTGSNGVNYVIDTAVAVPAADPFGTGTLGSASAKIHAADPGSGGNLDAAGLSGQLKSGVYYKNPNAISGGSEKSIAVVAQADLDALKATALADLSSRAEPEFKQSLAQGAQLVPNSESVADPQLSFSNKAGDDATQVSVSGSQAVNGQIFDPASLAAKARDEVSRRLASQVGTDVVLLGDTLTIGQAQPLQDGTSFSIRAEGRVRQVISSDEQAGLASKLAGKSLADAESIVHGVPGVASDQITIKPDWLPKRMPELARNIKVEASGSTSDATQGP